MRREQRLMEVIAFTGIVVFVLGCGIGMIVSALTEVNIGFFTQLY